MNFSNLFQEPPPELVFELSEGGVTVAKTSDPLSKAFHALPPGVISASPLRDNVTQPEVLAATVLAAAPANGNRKRRRAAVILPDYCARLSVLDFDNFPDKPEDQMALVRFRIKKTVPFDVDSAAISYKAQSTRDVIVAATPADIIAHYEAPFRAAQIQPGFVTISSLACLELVKPEGIQVIGKINGHVLTVMVFQNGVIKLIRSLELTEFTISEIAADLYPTFVYVEDQFGARVDKLTLSGFGGLEEEARKQFQSELGVPVDALQSRFGAVTERDAGLLGYLQGLHS
ncbi:MAG: hypothetical protein M3Z36_01850 [Acidobacteriota bacterium]|nr:hypothetical protein [Acidobacteriota bacterium]